MKEKRFFSFVGILILLFIFAFPGFVQPEEESGGKEVDFEAIEARVSYLMEEGDMPGLSLILIPKDRPVYIKGFGYADVKKKKPVTADTLFELASCSKAFTALAALHLEREGLIDLDAPVSRYLEGFYVTYEGKKHHITLRQLLHQTGGIPVNTISKIPEGAGKDALQQTARNVVGVELNRMPGQEFEYATVNYDIIGAVIEKQSGLSFEEYMKKNILSPLGLDHTVAGVTAARKLGDMATGYKIGFFEPREYEAPVYRGNNPAGYMVSNAKDMAEWLKFQLGLEQSDLYPLMQKTQQPDHSVLPNNINFSLYAMGWYAYVSNLGIVDHAGNNPNFTAYVSMVPEEKIAVVVLCNSSSDYTNLIGYNVLNMLRGRGPVEPKTGSNTMDKGASVVTFIFAFAILCCMLYFLSIAWGGIKKKRSWEKFTLQKAGKLALGLLVFIPFLIGIYFVPGAVRDVSWDTFIAWSPVSIHAAIIAVLGLLAIMFVNFVFSVFLPHKNKYLKSAPMVLVLSLLSGGSNAVIIFLVTNALFNTRGLFYQLYYFSLAFFLYILGRKVLQTKMIRITLDVVFDLRLKLIEKICYTSYQSFERIQSGRVLATLGDDTGQIANAANTVINLTTGVVTTLTVFVYLASIAFTATLLTSAVVLLIATLYYFVSRKSMRLFEEGRDTQNAYMDLVNGLIDGFKELSLKFSKKKEFKKDIDIVCNTFRDKIGMALIKFVNAFLVGESMLMLVLGLLGFGIPRLFPDVATYTLMSFIMVLLFLIGPITAILNSIPILLRAKVSWNRVREFMEAVPGNISPDEVDNLEVKKRTIESIEVKGLKYEYQVKNEKGFSVGPIDLKVKKGEVLFIIGGNGSGKTTLGKLLTGLYIPDAGGIAIDGKLLDNYQLGEYYSAVFSDYHLFEKLYNIDVESKENEAYKYINLLRLEEKVVLEENSFSTIDLSGGQRKRLALLQCFLEDSPIYLFDEVAADQDPVFRKFFYRELLPKMKADGKIVIAITHDDHYFDVADKIIKMDMGKLAKLADGSLLRVTA
ncbi:MAG: cyclic peptide export ABC transporter [Candidatus Aminicenantes bacterium]|nr:cyclic peptide export ABC transporter [Candidatus Aminicenantes bacterium]